MNGFSILRPDEQGRRGSEGSKVLAWLPEKMIAFSWTFPPDVPELRYAGEMTQVVVHCSTSKMPTPGPRTACSCTAGRKARPGIAAGVTSIDAWSLVLERLNGVLGTQ